MQEVQGAEADTERKNLQYVQGKGEESKMMKKAIGSVAGLTAIGVGTGLGAKAVSAAGGDASGLNALAGFQPAMGAIAGAGITLGMVKDIAKPLKKTPSKKFSDAFFHYKYYQNLKR